jgi:hypothetical protein
VLLGALFCSAPNSFDVRGRCARIFNQNLSTAQRYNSILPRSILVEIAARNLKLAAAGCAEVASILKQY